MAAERTRQLHLRAIPLGAFGIPLGLAGVGGAWSVASSGGVIPRWPEEVWFGIACVLWLWFTTAYGISVLRHREILGSDLRHPAHGPFIAFIPVIGMVLNQHYGSLYSAASAWVCVALVGLLALVDASLIAQWLTGGVGREALHVGYLLPVVTGSFVSSIGLSAAGMPGPSVAAFGVGVFFFVVLGPIIIGRLIAGPPLPSSLRSTVAILLAAPSTGGLALFANSDSGQSRLQLCSAGVVVAMFLAQVMLIPYYRRIPFGLAYWAFLFPLASAASYAIRWIQLGDSAIANVATWASLGVLTLVVAAISVASIVYALRQSGGNPI
ncbi:TDT family transporter [Lacisediminihabitans profunda]|uniref:SLAC1 family transporter n=1 Tax=Lacisediminihabitans profunda TaxID=2594790 RepID=UPI0016505660|nr:TDT family transporter [Lacisediminihabitans profunda]